MILEINDWHTKASAYKREQKGDYRITDYVYKTGMYPYYYMDGYSFFKFNKPETLTLLQEFRDSEWRDWMIDSPMDVRAMEKYAENAKGDVLCGGLGLGLITYELAKNSSVTNITVVERASEVISLVAEYLPSVTLIQDDFWHFIEQDNTKWGMIVLDIWATKGKDEHRRVHDEYIIPGAEKLKAKYPNTRLVVHGFADVTEVPLVEPSFRRRNAN